MILDTFTFEPEHQYYEINHVETEPSNLSFNLIIFFFVPPKHLS